MSVPTITPLTNLPSIADPTNFDARADNLITVQFPQLVSEINAAGEAIDQAVEDARDAASVAINGSSSSSVLLGSGNKSFTVLAGHSWSVGTWLMITSRANPSTHWFVAQVTAYSGTLLTVSIHSFGGSGSRADWDISITAKPPPLATTTADGLMSAADKVKVNGAAPLASPALTGTPTAPTAAPGTNTTQLANTAFVAAALAALLGGAPSLLNTFDELAAAMGDDPNFATTVLNQLASKLAAAGGEFTGPFTSPSASAYSIASGALTPAVANGHMQRFTAPTAAWAFNAPVGTANDYDMEVIITNPATAAGAMTPSGWTFADTSAYANTANARFKAMISVRGAHKGLRIVKDS